MHSTVAAGLHITRIVEPGRIDAVRLARVASEAAPASTRKSNAKVKSGAKTTTEISTEIHVASYDKCAIRLVAVRRDGLFVVLQFLLDTRPVSNQLPDFRLQLTCVLSQILELIE